MLCPGSLHPPLQLPSLANSAVIVELVRGGGGTVLILSDSKLNFSFLLRHWLLTQKAKAEARGILLGGKAQGVTFGLGGAGLRRSPLASRTQSAPGWGHRGSAGWVPEWGREAEKGSPARMGEEDVSTCIARPGPATSAPSGTCGEGAQP